MEIVSFVGQPIPVTTNIDRNSYNFLKLIAGADQLRDRIITNFTKEDLEGERVYWIDKFDDSQKFSEINMVRQFLDHYKDDENPKTAG